MGAVGTGMEATYDLDAERTGRVQVHRDSESEPASIWASCDLESGERMEILSQADRVMDVDAISHGTEIGTVTISDGDVEFDPDELVLEDYGYDD